MLTVDKETLTKAVECCVLSQYKYNCLVADKDRYEEGYQHGCYHCLQLICGKAAYSCYKFTQTISNRSTLKDLTEVRDKWVEHILDYKETE